MPIYQGQTNTVLRIQLPSAILTARFLETCFPANTEIAFEVLTVYVGDTALIEVDFLDAQGSLLHTHKGTVHSDLHRARINTLVLIPKPGPNLRIQMKVRLPKHNLTYLSDWARVDSPIAITEVAIKNAKGAVPNKIHIGDLVHLSARILGDAEKLPCSLALEVTYSDKRVLVWQSFATEVSEGKAQVECKITRHQDEAKFLSQHKTKPKASTYAAPKIQLRVTCMGLSEISPAIPLSSQTKINLPQKAKALIELPTGEMSTVDLSPEQPFEVPENQVGVYRLIDLDPIDEKGQSLTNQVLPGHPDGHADTNDDEPPASLPPMTPAT